MRETYDVVLVKGCTSTPDLDGIVELVPALTDPDVQTRMLGWRQHWPDFLGLDLPEDVALLVYAHLKQAGAHGGLHLAAYREPRITAEQALPIAARAIAERQARHSGVAFSPIRISEPHVTAECWAFCAECEQWQREGMIPGAVFADVDKLDGHVWTSEEFEQRGLKADQHRAAVARLIAGHPTRGGANDPPPPT